MINGAPLSNELIGSQMITHCTRYVNAYYNYCTLFAQLAAVLLSKTLALAIEVIRERG
jgi:hypothetical protein